MLQWRPQVYHPHHFCQLSTRQPSRKLPIKKTSLRTTKQKDNKSSKHIFFIFSSRACPSLGASVSHDLLLGRWRLSLDLFGRVFTEDVGLEPGSVVAELGGFPLKEVKFRRDMEKLRNSQQRDLTLHKVGTSLKSVQLLFCVKFVVIMCSKLD